MTSGSYWSSQQHASVITLKNRQQRPLTRLCYENSHWSSLPHWKRHPRAPPVIPAKAGTQTGSAGVPARILALAKGRRHFHRPYVAWQCHGLCYENSSMSQATELPRTEVRGLRTHQTGGFSPRDIHPRGEAYPCQRPPPFSSTLCGLATLPHPSFPRRRESRGGRGVH